MVAGRNASDTLMFGEVGTDGDEAAAIIFSCWLARKGYINPLGFVGNHVEALQRARNAKWIFTRLGFGDLPVGMGERGFGSTSQEFERDPRYLAAPTKIGDGRELLKWVLEHSEENSVVLVMNSGFSDLIWAWMHKNVLFRQKVRKVVVMGGVDMDGAYPALSRAGFLTPSTDAGGAANNNFDAGSALHLYRSMQEHGIPTVTVTRFAAYACKMPFNTFDRMGEAGSAIAARIAEMQAERIRELWRKANAPVGSVQREHLPARCDRAWFLNTFCGGQEPKDDILQAMTEVAWYDPMNTLASSDELRERFFDPFTLEVNGASHQVIGLTAESHGVRHPDSLQQFMLEGFEAALRYECASTV